MRDPIVKIQHNFHQRDEHSITSTFVLVVDDDSLLLSSLSRILKRAGYEPVLASSAEEAMLHLENKKFATILSDINLPGMKGTDFLKNVRRYDLDVPVLLITGEPSVNTAVSAVELGAFRYLLKPIHPLELTESVRLAIRMHKLANLKRNSLELLGSDPSLLLGERSGLEVRFDHALETLWMAMQPIVSMSARKIYAYEALVRTEEKTLEFPGALILAAERLNRLDELGRLVRKKVSEIVHKGPDHMKLFVNLHSLDLNDAELYKKESPLSLFARQIVLEITERASLDGISDLTKRIARLRELGFQIAIDDLGAGYAGLSSFTQLNPEIIKLDMSLIRGIDKDLRKQSVVKSMAELSRELGIITIAEGVETFRERDILLKIGCNLLQGFLFATPSRGFDTYNNGSVELFSVSSR